MMYIHEIFRVCTRTRVKNIKKSDCVEFGANLSTPKQTDNFQKIVYL